MNLWKIILLACAGFILGFNGFRKYEARQVEQPYKFNHAAHRIMACIRCHEGAEDGIKATLPSAETCLNCHKSSPNSDQEEVAAWDASIQKGGFQWKKMTSVPDHVFFSHRRHTKLGKLSCVTCHGDVQDKTVPPSLPLIRIKMDLCIDCHQQRGESDDCARCHK